MTTGLECKGTQMVGAGAACACANDCASNECVTIDPARVNYVCADPCTSGACSVGFACQGTGTNSYCFADTAAPAPAKSGGCSAAPLDPADPEAWRAPGSVLGLALAFFAGSRRRARSRVEERRRC